MDSTEAEDEPLPFVLHFPPMASAHPAFHTSSLSRVFTVPTAPSFPPTGLFPILQRKSSLFSPPFASSSSNSSFNHPKILRRCSRQQLDSASLRQNEEELDEEIGEEDGRGGGDDFFLLDLESMEEEARDLVREYSASLSRELDIGIVSSSAMLPLVY